MKVDRNKLKRLTTEAPQECRQLIEKIKNCDRASLQKELSSIRSWPIGKCELYHWVDVLDLCDSILEQCVARTSWMLACDREQNSELKQLLLSILHFTALLVEHSYSRHLYNSVEHLTILLQSSDISVVLAVLNLLYVFSKRSNYVSRLPEERKRSLLSSLCFLAQSWGGKENGFDIARCCKIQQLKDFPEGAATFNFDFTQVNDEKITKSPSELMEQLINEYDVPVDKRVELFTQLRLAFYFAEHSTRLMCIQARLQALSIIIYSSSNQENLNSLLHEGLVEELAETLTLTDDSLTEIKAAALKTLTSIIHLERNIKLQEIIDSTQAYSYHGFLPTLVRQCVDHLVGKDPNPKLYPQHFVTALFSFLYHLASYENGGEALVSCSVIKNLLEVVKYHVEAQDFVMFVTRAVRVIDLITNLDMAGFQNAGGIQAFVDRLNFEVMQCKKKQPFTIVLPARKRSLSCTSSSTDGFLETISEEMSDPVIDLTGCQTGLQCFHQRAALLKSILNFLKKIIPDPSMTDGIRHIMEGSLPESLKHIVSNAEYYGPSLFLLAADLVTVHIFQEPSQLSYLQEIGLADVLLYALLEKEVPAAREVLASLPNVFSALCLNNRGLRLFLKCKPFEKLFKVLLNPSYLPAMRRRRSSELGNGTASNLGNAMDELMRHQPSLKVDAIKAAISLLNQLNELGSSTQYKFVRYSHLMKSEVQSTGSKLYSNTESQDDYESEIEDEDATNDAPDVCKKCVQKEGQTEVSLYDYITNVMKFIEAVLSNNSTDDHCKEFIKQGGLPPLLEVLSLPNLPIDFPTSTASQSVNVVCKAILTLTKDPQVIEITMIIFDDLLLQLDTAVNAKAFTSSVLLRELISCQNLVLSYNNSDELSILRMMCRCHSYVNLLCLLCKVSQAEVRSVILSQWGSDFGLSIINLLRKVCMFVIWETSALIACINNDKSALTPETAEDLEKLNAKIVQLKNENQDPNCAAIFGGIDSSPDNMFSHNILNFGNVKEINVSQTSLTSECAKFIKPMLHAVSKFGRSLGELFNLLIKLCVGSPIRQRRNAIPANPVIPSNAAVKIAFALANLLYEGFAWIPPLSCTNRARLSFYTCTAGFAVSMLLDDRRRPYHLMLLQFQLTGAQQKMFDTLYWTLSLFDENDNERITDGAVEYIETSLLLIHRLINHNMILDSPFTIPTTRIAERPYLVPFDPIRYITDIHKVAFRVVSQLWDKRFIMKQHVRLVDIVLSIICLISNGRRVIISKLAERNTESSFPEENSGINTDHVTQIMTMGFSREHAIDGLLHANGNLESAVDYCVNHSQAAVVSGLPSDIESSDDPELLRAIQMSCQTLNNELQNTKDEDITPLSHETIIDFTNSLPSGCLELLDSVPDSVYRICDLIVIVANRNTEWIENFLRLLCTEIIDLLYAIRLCFSEINDSLPIHVNEKHEMLSNRLLLFNLLFEELPISCALMSQNFDLMSASISTLRKCYAYMVSSYEIGNKIFFSWLTPLFILFDLYEKASTSTKRKILLKQRCKGHFRVWKWFDDRYGKWMPYSVKNNLTIDNAFMNGSITVKITANRRNYVINFLHMLQMNTESHFHRPIIFWLVPTTALQEESDCSPVRLLSNPKFLMPPFPLLSLMGQTQDTKTCHVIQGLSDADKIFLVEAAATFISLEIDSGCIHALLRLVLRFTRQYTFAEVFARSNGLHGILNMTQKSNFTGCVSYFVLILRHIIEDEKNLYLAMEKAIRHAMSGNIPSGIGISTNAVVSRELYTISRILAPSLCRDPDICINVVKDVLRILPPQNRRAEEDVQAGCGVFQLKTLPAKFSSTVPLNLLSETVIRALLDYLVLDHTKPENKNGVINSSSQDQELKSEIVAESHLKSEDNVPSKQPGSSSVSEVANDKFGKDSSHFSEPLFKKSTILRVLSELIRNYAGIAKLVATHMYKAQQSPEITETVSALAYIIDNLMSLNSSVDKDCQYVCKVFITSLASCNHCVESQNILVGEIKSALYRVLALPDCNDKHAKVQALAGIISTMIEACPPGSLHSGSYRSHQISPINNMIKIMHKRGLIVDLAHAINFFSFSCEKIIDTINALLKPLEILSRALNSPSVVAVNKPGLSYNGNNAVLNNSTNDSSGGGDAAENRSSNSNSALSPNQHLVNENAICEFLEPLETLPQEVDENGNGAIVPLLNAENDDPFTMDDVDYSHTGAIIRIETDSHGDRQVSIELNEDSCEEEDDEDDNSDDDDVDDNMESPSLTHYSDDDEEASSDDDTVHNRSQYLEVSHDAMHVGDESTDDENDEDEPDESDMDDEDEEVEEEEEEEEDDDDDDDDDVDTHDTSVNVDESADDFTDDLTSTVGRYCSHLNELSNTSRDDVLNRSNLGVIDDEMDAVSEVDYEEEEEEGDEIDDEDEDEEDEEEDDEDNEEESDPENENLDDLHSLHFGLAEEIFMQFGDMFPDAEGITVSAPAGAIRASLRFTGSNSRITAPGHLVADPVEFSTLPSSFSIPPHHPLLVPRYEPSFRMQASSRQNGTDLDPINTDRLGLADSHASNLSRNPLHFYLLRLNDRLSDRNSAENLEVSPSAIASSRILLSPHEPLNTNDSTRFVNAIGISSLPNSLQDSSLTEYFLIDSQDNVENVRTPLARWMEECYVVDGYGFQESIIAYKIMMTDVLHRIRISEFTEHPEINQHPETVLSENSREEAQSLEASASEATTTTAELTTNDTNSNELIDFHADIDQSLFSHPNDSTEISLFPDSGELQSVSSSSTTYLSASEYFDLRADQSQSQEAIHDTIENDDRNIGANDVDLRLLHQNLDTQIIGSRENDPNAESEILLERIHYLIGRYDNALESEAQGTVQNENTAERNEVHAEVAAEADLSSADPELITITIDGREMQVPATVDPSFLAALPDSLRDEVVAQEIRIIQNRRQARIQNEIAHTQLSSSVEEEILEINPEFLAALPPEVQEEVLTQQRIQQARLVNSGGDPTGFLRCLPPTLRQQILTDMEESEINLLPQDLAQEARNLREHLTAHVHQQAAREQFNRTTGSGMFGVFSMTGGRSTNISRGYTLRAISDGGHRGNRTLGNWSSFVRTTDVPLNPMFKGKVLLDYDSLCCLLITLFIDDSRVHVNRLQRVVRNLCHHVGTRSWIIKSLLSIIKKSTGRLETETVHRLTKKGGGNIKSSPSAHSNTNELKAIQPCWLTMYLTGAFGSKTNVFSMYKSNSKKSQNVIHLSIHSQACPNVCRQVLDVLIVLAKTFPSHFITSYSKFLCDDYNEEKIVRTGKSDERNEKEPSFWDLLLRLDAMAGRTRQFRLLQRQLSLTNFFEPYDAEIVEDTPFAYLMDLLNHCVLNRSSMLMDKLFRLLSLISQSLPNFVLVRAKIPTIASSNGTHSGEIDYKNGQKFVSKPKPAETGNEMSSTTLAPINEVVLSNQITVIVNVLISKICSEDGLEYATDLLMNMSKVNEMTKQWIMKLVLDGLKSLGGLVEEEIQELFCEVAMYLAAMNIQCPNMEVQKSQNLFGKYLNKTANGEKQKVRELQLPSMTCLTSKNSNQQFFLRILKVIMQLRKATKNENKSEQPSQSHRSAAAISSALIIDVNNPQHQNEPIALEEYFTPSSSNIMNESGVCKQAELKPLSHEINLDSLWKALSECLIELQKLSDSHAVLVLQPCVEAFFIVHSSPNSDAIIRNSTTADRDLRSNTSHLMYEPVSSLDSAEMALGVSESTENVKEGIDPDAQKFLDFATAHRKVLNNILRQSTQNLSEGPFSILTEYTHVLDFDVKRKHFRHELDKLKESIRGEDLAIHVRRESVFEDSYRELNRRSLEEWKHRFYIVFEGEEGQDAGGLLREWYTIISKEIFNPNYALFMVNPGDRVTYMPNPSSHCNSNHLSYFKFVGRVIAKAIFDNKYLDCFFTRFFYKHILGVPVKHTDMESVDNHFYKNLCFIIQNDVENLDLNFSTDICEFGVTKTIDLVENGRNTPVTNANKMHYIRLVCREKMIGSIRQQTSAFLDGFYSIIPKRLISIFNEQELELLISGLPDIDIEDLKANTEYHKYRANSLQIQWFWRALRSFEKDDLAKFLQFVTGTSKVPLGGFAHLEGMNGPQKFQIHRDDRSTERLPCAHTCFNQLDLPAYETYDKLRSSLLIAIHECLTGFGLA